MNDGREKMLEIQSIIDGSMMKIRMVDTSGGHYDIVLETKTRLSSSFLSACNAPEDIPIMFLEDAREDLCSFRAVRKVHEINQHKSKEQLIAAYNNTGWMSPELVTINRVVNDCMVCKKFQKSITRPRATLPKSYSFNEIITLDLKKFGSRYALLIGDSFTIWQVNLQ